MWGMANSHSPAWRSDCRCETVVLTLPCPGCLLDLLPLGKDLGCVIPLGNTLACSTARSVSSPSLSACDCFSLLCFVFCSFVFFISHSMFYFHTFWAMSLSCIFLPFPPSSNTFSHPLGLCLFHFSSLPPNITLSISEARWWGFRLPDPAEERGWRELLEIAVCSGSVSTWRELGTTPLPDSASSALVCSHRQTPSLS